MSVWEWEEIQALLLAMRCSESRVKGRTGLEARVRHGYNNLCWPGTGRRSQARLNCLNPRQRAGLIILTAARATHSNGADHLVVHFQLSSSLSSRSGTPEIRRRTFGRLTSMNRSLSGFAINASSCALLSTGVFGALTSADCANTADAPIVTAKMENVVTMNEVFMECSQNLARNTTPT
jgi:hypothetical protein